jgi:hypothetical protein
MTRWGLLLASGGLAAALLLGAGAAPWRESFSVAASPIPAARLLDTMADLRGNAGARARDLLTKRGAVVVPALIARLKHPAPETRAAAAIVLGNLRDPRAVRPLCAVLADPDARVRYRAAYTLGRLKDPAAVPYLAPLLAEPLDQIQQVAIRALEECRCKVRPRNPPPGYEIRPAGATAWQPVAPRNGVS